MADQAHINRQLMELCVLLTGFVNELVVEAAALRKIAEYAGISDEQFEQMKAAARAQLDPHTEEVRQRIQALVDALGIPKH